MKEIKYYQTTCFFCEEPGTVRVISAKYGDTGVLDVDLPLRADGFDLEHTHDEQTRCSSCGQEAELELYEVAGLHILVEEEYLKDYQNGRHEFETDYGHELELTEYPTLGDYSAAFPAGRVATFQIYEHQSPSLESLSRALWFFTGWMQRWTEVAEG